jgi:CRISPR-associated protein Cmr1
MEEQTYSLRFITPAFLGNAEPNGAWRTPSVKALLKQWWRIVKTNELVNKALTPERLQRELREAEGRLFGHAWLTYRENNHEKAWAMHSQMLIGLEGWQSENKPGNLSAWRESDSKVQYLGYSPLIYNKVTKQAALKEKVNAAIQADETSTLHIAYRSREAEELLRTLQLIHWFGSIGNRSRSGWGSLTLEALTGIELERFEVLDQNHALLNAISRPLNECLELDWPHALGTDTNGKPLLWRTQQGSSQWRDTMKELARVKIALRTTFKFAPSRVHKVDRRPMLVYPVTNHPVTAWSNQAHLANQLRFKVIVSRDQFFGIAYHLPCGVPNELLGQPGHDRNWIQQQQLAVWQAVHDKLDREMRRIY